MSRQIQIRRGDNTKHQKFTGAIGEVTMNTTKNTLCVHDGKTVGGNELLSRSDFYSYITNCITEIPQDIKLELNDGTLILKSGSKVYVPNGKNANDSNKFDEAVIKNDINVSVSSSQNGTWLLFYRTDGLAYANTNIENCLSGTTVPGTGTIMFYNTNNNTTRYVNNGSVSGVVWSLPLAKISKENNVISIDQVFNGLGYIGSTLFALPGVKGLIPNGRNEDGTLKNILTNNTSVKTVTKTSAETSSIVITKSGSIDTYATFNYSSNMNFNYTSIGNYTNGLHAGTVVFGSGGKVESFAPKLVFSFAA